MFLGLWICNMPFGILMTGIGCISLAGVVVNNAIVLLDFINQLRARGVALEDAVVQAGIIRFRPVMLTAGTTSLGLVPMALGINFDFKSFEWTSGGETAQWWGSMAVAVIFGLTFATVLTLVVVPALYTYAVNISILLPKPSARPVAEPSPNNGRLDRRDLVDRTGQQTIVCPLHSGPYRGYTRTKEPDHVHVACLPPGQWIGLVIGLVFSFWGLVAAIYQTGFPYGPIFV